MAINADLIKSQMNKYLDQLDTKLTSVPYLNQIASKTQLKPSYIVLSATLVVFLFLVWGFGAKFVANLVGFGYPLYESFRSLNDSTVNIDF